MAIPGFTATAASYVSTGHYRGRGQASRAGAAIVSPAYEVCHDECRTRLYPCYQDPNGLVAWCQELVCRQVCREIDTGVNWTGGGGPPREPLPVFQPA